MSTASIRILLLEDDEALAQALLKSLKKRGQQCYWQKTIEDFHAFLQTGADIDLVLMDLKLETQSSLAYIKDARRQYPMAKIFMVTGFASIATTVEAIKQGADDYLPKPVSAQDILNRFYAVSDIAAEVTEERLSPKRLEWEHIQQVLQENNGNISKTADVLNMHRRTLQRKLQKKSPI